MSAPDEKACGIDVAAYEADVGGRRPWLLCSCGFTAKGDTWEEAGAEMDAHLDTEEDA